MPLEAPDSPEAPDLEARNADIERVAMRFGTAVLARVEAVFSDADYLGRIHALGVFHRIARLALASGVDFPGLPDPGTCARPEAARAFALSVIGRHDEYYECWLVDRRRGAEDRSFRDCRPDLDRAYALLLVAGNVARASTWQDWRVDREDDVLTDRLGLNGSLLDVETALAEEYTRPGEHCLHYIKGPGNGVTVEAYDAQHERKLRRGAGGEEQLSKVVDHVRVGDRLYFDVGPILDQFIRPELLTPLADADAERERLQQYRHARQVVDILTHALQHRLRELWAPGLRQALPNRGAGQRSAAAPAPQFFDLNEIFRLLRDPDRLFQGVVELGRVLDSKEFVGDDTRTMSMSMRRWLSGYRRRSLSGADVDAVEWRQFREDHLIELYGQRILIEDIIRELSPFRVPPPQTDRLRVIARLCQEYSGQEVPERECNRDDLFRRMEELRSAVEDDITWLVSLRRSGAPRSGRRITGAPGTTALNTVFTDGFVAAVNGAETLYGTPGYYQRLPADGIDLNDRARFASRNFLPAFFTDFPAALGPSAAGTALLISSVRSDSHETGDMWRRDIAQNVALLQPGGMLVVDGHRESYSREYRTLDQEFPDCSMWWVMHQETGHPLSLIIQRRHPTRPLLDENDALRARLLDADCRLANPSDVLRLRLDLCIANRVRAEVAGLVGAREEFIGLHRFIEEEVRNRLVRSLCRQYIREFDEAAHGRVLHLIFETTRSHIYALINRAVEREMARRSAAARGPRSAPRRRDVEREVSGYFGRPMEATIPEKVDATELMDSTFKQLRAWVMKRFDATEDKVRQRQLQVKEHFSDGILRGLVAAVVRESPEDGMDEGVLWDVARNIGMSETPVLAKPGQVCDDVVKDTLERIRKMLEARRRMASNG